MTLETEEEEVAILKSNWDAFAAENPQKAQELQDVVREGVRGVTYREQIARKLDTLMQAFTENSELVEEVKRVEQEALQSGRDADQAKELSTIAGVVANSMNKQYGTDVKTGINLAFKSVTGRNQQGSQAESYGQDARNGDNTTLKVPDAKKDPNMVYRDDYPIGSINVKTEKGHNLLEAGYDELIVNDEGSKNLGTIDEVIAHAANIQPGNIQANVGLLFNHLKEDHIVGILQSGYEDIISFLFDILKNYTHVYIGSGKSLLLSKSLGKHHGVAAVELLPNSDGNYRVKTLLTMRENKISKKKLLFQRSEPSDTGPVTSETLRTTQNKTGYVVPTAMPKSDISLPLTEGNINNNFETYHQSEEPNENDQINARISWPFGTTAAESQSIVEFLSTANKSTGFHELWHHVFRVLTDAAELSNASDLLKHDVGVILRNAGVSREDFYGNVGNARTKAQEFFAKSGEAYLREGTAPTPELVSTFERIKDWLVEIYKNIKESLGIELNDEMRDIFDRLLATPEQLAEQKSAEEIDTLYNATQEELEYTQAEIERIEAELAEAEARETMANEMRDYVFEPIPQEVIDAVNDWITASEHEGEVEEQYAADLNSRKKSVRETARERIINMTRNVPLIEVNTNTLNALIAQGGIETTKQYLNERRAYLEKLQKSLEASLPAKNAGVAYQRGEIERLEKRRTSLQNKVKRLQKNPQANAFAIRTMQNEIEDITARLKDLRDERKGPQSEYDTAKKDISNILNEQREIADSLSALERIENADENTPVDYTESEVSDEDLITLAEALQRGYELAERYGLAGFEEGRTLQQKIDTEQAAQELEAERTEHNREIAAIKEQSEKKLDDEILLATMKAKEIHDKDQAKLKAVREQAKIRLQERLAKLKQNQKLMNERQNERRRIRAKMKKLRNAINRMAKSQSVLWARHEEIVNFIGTYNPDKKGEVSLREGYTLKNFEDIYERVKELYDTGKRELAAKNLLTQERVNKMRQEIMATMQKDWDNRPRGAVRHAGDTSKEYNGLKGKVSKLIDWTMANAMGAQRFFDFLDGGQKYQGAWSKYFSDEANKAYDKELRFKFARYLDLENFLKSAGISTKKLTEVRDVKVPHQGSKGWTVDELMSIYAGLKNPRSKMAILYGNFSDAETIEQAESWATECVKALTDQERAVADFIIQEYEKHFDRINEALIDIYNRGMVHEENYTPMRRIDYSTKRDGVLDPDAAENLMSSQQGVGFRSVDTGFTKSRQDISAQNQKGIELGLVSMWYSQVETQEHAAAFGQLVSDLRKILMARPKDGETTVRQMVKQTRGLPAWTMIRQYFNTLAVSDTLNAYDALDGIAKTLARNMSVAYLCGNLGTALKQLGSLPRVLPYAGPTATLNAIAQFMQNPAAFIEECYRLDPQLKNRKGDLLISELRRGAGSWYDTLLAAGNYLIGVSDRVASAIVWKAVYDAIVKTLKKA